MAEKKLAGISLEGVKDAQDFLHRLMDELSRRESEGTLLMAKLAQQIGLVSAIKKRLRFKEAFADVEVEASKLISELEKERHQLERQLEGIRRKKQALQSLVSVPSSDAHDG